MITELESFFSVLDWLHASGPYVTESVFPLTLSCFIASMYIIMKIRRRNAKK